MNKKITPVLLLLLLNFSIDSFAQLKLNGGGKINISGGTSSSTIFFVINNPISSPVATSGATDGIIMEAEYNRLQYNLGTATTAITVPFMSSLLESFPLTVTPTSAGAGSGKLLFSSTKAATRSTGFDNSVYKPSDITTMSSGVSAIDRFWIIDATNYTTKPAVNLSFTYIDAEWAANGGNSINEDSLTAQRFNNTANSWQSTTLFPPTGTVNTTTNTVSNVIVSASNFYRSWTLSNKAVYLPLFLLNFDATKITNDEVKLNWTTATEINNDYFTIQRSQNGTQWDNISTIEGAGNSAQLLNYVDSDYNPLRGTSYYRLKMIDFDGNDTYSEIRSVAIKDIEFTNVYPNPASSNCKLVVYSKANNPSTLEVFNMLGEVVKKADFDLKKGMNQYTLNVENLTNGSYRLRVISLDGLSWDDDFIIVDVK